MQLFLSNLANPNLLDDAQHTPLYYAIKSKSKRCGDVIRLLLEYDASLFYSGDDGRIRNMFVLALLNGNDVAARIMFERQSALLKNDVEKNRLTCQHLLRIVLTGSCETISFLSKQVRLSYMDTLITSYDSLATALIEQKCKDDVTSFRPQPLVYVSVTPLHAAAMCCDVNMVNLLLHLGASARKVNDKGQTSADLVKIWHDTSQERPQKVLKILNYESQVQLIQNNDVTEDDHVTKTVSKQGHIYSESQASNQNVFLSALNDDEIKGSLPQIFPLNSPKTHLLHSNETRLKKTTQDSFVSWETYINYSWSQIKLALKSGLDPNRRDLKGRTLLHCVSQQARSVKTLELLLQWSSDPNVVDADGNTPLTLAVTSQGPNVFTFVTSLLEYGASLKLKKRTQNAFRLALQRKLVDILQMLFSYFPKDIQEDLNSDPLNEKYVQ